MLSYPPTSTVILAQCSLEQSFQNFLGQALFSNHYTKTTVLFLPSAEVPPFPFTDVSPLYHTQSRINLCSKNSSLVQHLGQIFTNTDWGHCLLPDYTDTIANNKERQLEHVILVSTERHRYWRNTALDLWFQLEDGLPFIMCIHAHTHTAK